MHQPYQMLVKEGRGSRYLIPSLAAASRDACACNNVALCSACGVRASVKRSRARIASLCLWATHKFMNASDANIARARETKKQKRHETSKTNKNGCCAPPPRRHFARYSTRISRERADTHTARTIRADAPWSSSFLFSDQRASLSRRVRNTLWKRSRHARTASSRALPHFCVWC